MLRNGEVVICPGCPRKSLAIVVHSKSWSNQATHDNVAKLCAKIRIYQDTKLPRCPKYSDVETLDMWLNCGVYNTSNISEEEYDENSEIEDESENGVAAPKLSLLQAIKREVPFSPKAVLMEMMNIIDGYGHNGYRRSWEMLIEFLGRYLGLMTNPWVYSDPERDVKRVIDRTNPRRVSAFQLKWEGAVGASKMIILPPTKPHHIFYFAHNYVNQWVSNPEKLEGEKKRLYELLMKKGLLERYVDAARKDPWDHLGDIFTEWQLGGKANRLGQMLTPKNIITFMVSLTLGEVNKDGKHKPYEPITDLDPAVGTGRFLIIASLMYPEKPLVLFGIEIDITLYRACLVNMALFSSHPYSILCADALRFFNDNADAWAKGNLWNPQDMSPYYWGYGRESTRAHSLSFEELIKRKQERLQAERELHIEPELETQQSITVLPSPRFSLENYVKSKKQKVIK